MFGNRSCGLGTSFEESAKIVGKMVGDIRKIVKNVDISMPIQ